MILIGKSQGVAVQAIRVLGAALAVGAAYGALRELPSLVRYLRMVRMAGNRSGATPTLLPGFDEPQYAQAPRRVCEADPHRGRERSPTL
jgi:hypothetical protein